MYNKEIKERFFRENEIKETYVAEESTFFEKIGVYESKISMDIAQMGRDSVVSAINSVEITEYSTAEHYMSILKNYTKWCLDNSVFDNPAGGALSLTIKDIDLAKILSKTLFRNDLEFVSAMRKVRTFDDGYPEPVYWAFAWLGVERKFVLSLKDSAVDLVNRVIYDEIGNVIVDGFSDVIYNVLDQYVRCNSSTRENGSSITEVIKDRSVDTFIKKFCSKKSGKFGNEFTDNQITSYTAKLNRMYESLGYSQKLTYTNIQESGGLYRVFQLEQSGVDVFSKKNANLVQKAFRIPKQYYKIIWKYKFYKEAFDL